MTTTQAQIYLYLNSVWTDVTSDVLSAGRISGEYGMRDDRARIADIGTLSFSLRNTDKKYTPFSATALSGWKKGTPVKLEVIHNGYTFVKFRGAVDNIQITGGTKGARSVSVTALDWLDYAAKYPLSSPAIEQNKTADYAIDTILDAMPIQPTTRTLAAGVSSYPTIFDAATAKTKAYSEFSKLVNSEPGYLYVKSGDEIVFEALDTRNGLDTLKQVPISDGILGLVEGGAIGTISGDYLGLSGTTNNDVVIDNTMIGIEVKYGDNMVNRFTSSAYPKRIDTTQSKLYELENPIYFASGQARTFEVQYTDPVSKRLVAALTPSDTGFVKSLLHFDTGGVRTIVDDTGKVWTANDVQLISNIVKFGDAALYFDGGDSWANTASSVDFEFGSGDFSIEWLEWRFNTTSGAATTKRDYSATYSPFTLGQSDGTNLLIYMSSNGSSNDIANGKTLGAITLNTWNHFEVTRRGNNFYAFKNGVLTDSWTSSAALVASSAVMSLGRNSSTYLTAVLDEFTVRKGSAGHTAGFTPPTEANTLSGVVYSAYASADSTGTELTGDFTASATFGSVSASITITNDSALNGYLTTLKIYSYLVQSETSITDIQESTASITDYGYQNDSLDMQYQQDILSGAVEGKRVVELNKEPRTILNRVIMAAKDELSMQYFLRVDIGDLVHISEDQTAVDAWYYIQGVDYSLSAGGDGTVNIIYSWIVKQAYTLENGLSLMACEFTGGTSQDSLNYGYLPTTAGDQITHRGYSVWIKLDAVSATRDQAIIGTYSLLNGTVLYMDSDATNRILAFYAWRFSGFPGKWTVTNAFSTGALTHLFISYDLSSVSNDPLLYVNGVLQSLTEVYTPLGTLTSEVGNSLVIGNWKTPQNDYDAAFDGTIKDARVYNMAGITPATLAAAIYAEGAGGTANTSGMVFQGPAIRTPDVTAYTGLTLTDETKMLETYIGAVGTPTGSPIARAM